jgi:predicted nucleotidyltransferase
MYTGLKYGRIIMLLILSILRLFREMIVVELKGLNIPGDYINDINKAFNILNKEGCKDIYLFGSLVMGNTRKGSDLDIAVKHCPEGSYFKILGKLMMELEHPVDLIVLDENDDFVNFIEQNGDLVHVS